ncbi:MAG: hypothetical protein HY692_04725 [Cyanobacteria bacterium NC_groundwater_1444_Ag_S-0.65um_54_12]|nr:hypothetical protein [Cyanobacteria bacterium NC_groundwater_1444_Ag_S-0.65um_54_12]
MKKFFVVPIAAGLFLASAGFALAKVNAGKVDPGKITYTQLRALSPKDFGTVAGRGMKSGMALMGGVPVMGQPTTLSGEIVDLVCYQSAGATSGQHSLCARVCALKGGPVGLLTGDGKVYQILPAKAGMPVSDDVLDAIATKVTVTGNVNERGSLPTIAITKITQI